jgi:hypothetical protein
MSKVDPRRNPPREKNLKDYGYVFADMVDIAKAGKFVVAGKASDIDDIAAAGGFVVADIDDIISAGEDGNIKVTGKVADIDDIVKIGKAKLTVKVRRTGKVDHIVGAARGIHGSKVRRTGKARKTVLKRRIEHVVNTEIAGASEDDSVMITVQSGKMSETLHYLPRRKKKSTQQAAFNRIVSLFRVLKSEILSAAEEDLSDHLSAGELEILDRYPTADFEEVAVALAEASRQRDRIESQALTTQQVASELGVDASRIRQRLEEGSLWGFKERRQWRVPTFQLRNGKLLRGIDEVNKALRREVDPVVVDGFFRNANVDLVVGEVSVTPLDWLAADGDPARVARIAADL